METWDTSLIGTPEFSSLLHRAWQAPLKRSELDASFIPEGFEADDVWSALLAIRRSQAYHSPQGLRTAHGTSRNWHNVPESLHYSLHRIAELTRKGSALDRIADERKGRRFITQQYVEEMVANLTFDGYAAEYEDVRSVLLEDRPPFGTAETIALNFHRIMQDLDQWEDRPFDECALQTFYNRLLDGADASESAIPQPEATSGIPRSPLESHYAAESGGPADITGLDVPIAIANGLVTEPTRHPIMVSMLVNCQFWRTLLFERCNNLMGCIASRFYLLKAGYPVFRYVPKIRILEKWRRGFYDEVVDCSYAEALSCANDEMDWTLYYDTVMRLMLREILTMERSLAVRKALDDRAIEGIAHIPYLSHRQQEVLRQAVLAPETEFFISKQQKKYGIVYSTARADLEKLADLGLLTRLMHGAAYSYRAVGDLKKMLVGYGTLN